jgi:hypothetical protein
MDGIWKYLKYLVVLVALATVINVSAYTLRDLANKVVK